LKISGFLASQSAPNVILAVSGPGRAGCYLTSRNVKTICRRWWAGMSEPTRFGPTHKKERRPTRAGTCGRGLFSTATFLV